MSYAAVASHNAPPPSQQPHPDPGLWTTEQDSASSVLNDTGPKVNVVETNFKEHPTVRIFFKTDSSLILYVDYDVCEPSTARRSP